MKLKGKKYLLVLLVSYALVLIVPFITGISSYLYSRKQTEREIFRANSAILEQAQIYIDQQMQQKDLLFSNVSLTPSLISFLTCREPITEDERYLLYTAAKSLYILKNSYSFISDFYVYFQNSNIILTPSAVYDPEMYYDVHLRGEFQDLTYEKWYDEVLNGVHRNAFFHGTESKYLTYIQSLPINLTQTLQANLVILIDSQKVRNLLGGLEWLNKGKVYIVNGKGQVVVSTDEEEAPDSLLDQMSGDQGYYTIRSPSGEKLAVSYISSSRQDWKYISVMPVSQYMERVEKMKWISIFLFVFSFAAGVTVILLAVHKTYSPIRDIIDALKQTEVESDGGDEFSIIQNTVMNTLTEDKRVRSIIQRQQPIIINDLMTDILKGQIGSDQTAKQLLSKKGVEWTYGCSLACVVDFDVGDFNDSQNFHEGWALIYVAVQEYWNEITLRYAFHTFLLETQPGTAVLLVNLDAGQIDGRLIPCLQEFQDFIGQTLGVPCSIGVGDAVEGVVGVSNSYLQAVRALDYRIFEDISQIIRYESIVHNDESYFYPSEMEQQVITLAKAGDYPRIEKMLDNIFYENLSNRNLSPDMLDFLFSEIMGTVIKIKNETKIDLQKILGDSFNPVTDLKHYKHVSEICGRIHSILKELCRSINQSKCSHNTQLLEEILAYVKENATREDLCLQIIADSFRISVPYLSRFFKEQTGRNISSYINEQRINIAKLLLRNTDGPIGKIAVSVGYNNDATFIRVFKKITGVTPGFFRKQAGNS